MAPQPINQVPVMAWSHLLHDLYPHLLCFRLAEGGVCVLQWKQRTLHEIAVERYLKTEEESISVCSVLASYFSGKMALELTGLQRKKNVFFLDFVRYFFSFFH